MVTSRWARGDDGGKEGEMEVGGSESVTDCGSRMGKDPICERRDVDAWNERLMIGIKDERDVDIVVYVIVVPTFERPGGG